MDELAVIFAVLLVLAVIGVTIVVPIIALVVARRSQAQLTLTRVELADARQCLRRLELQFAQLAEKSAVAPPAPIELASPLHEVVPSPTAPEPISFATSVFAEARRGAALSGSDAGVTEIPPVNSTPSVDALNQPPPPFNWEGLIGVRLFAWLGGGALFLGAALFLHYSIQQGLISPPVRVALGLIAGALLLLGGDRLRPKATLAGQAIAGAGVGTLYAALFAARALYHLIPLTPAFVGMILVTVTAGVLSVKRSAYLLATLGLVGGMATPFLLSSGEDHPWSLFGYVALLDAGIAWISKRRDWPTLALLGLCASVLVFIAWSTQYLSAYRAPYALLAVATVAGVFVSLLWSKPRSDSAPLGAALRTTAQCGVAIPLLAVLTMVHLPRMNVNPTFLTVYLVIVTLGATLVARRLEAPFMGWLSVALAVAAQWARTGGDLFPAHDVTTLASYCLLPLSQLGLWWRLRDSAGPKAPIGALFIALASPLVIATQAASCQSAPARYWTLGSYTAVHVLGLLWFAVRLAEPRLLVLGQAVAWFVAAAVRDQAGAAITGSWSLWIAASGLVFWSLPLFLVQLQGGRLAPGAAALALPTHFALLYWAAREQWDSGPLGLICVIGAVLMVLGIGRLRQVLAQDANQETSILALQGAMALAFLTAALPILVDKQWLTVAFGLEVAALAWLRRRLAHDGLVIAIGILAGVAFARLVLNPSLWEYHARSGIPVFNFYLYTFGLVACAFVVAAWQLQANDLVQRWRLRQLLQWSAVVLIFVLLNVEVADYFSTGSILVFQFSGGGLAQDMTYSLAWGLFALCLMSLGILKKQRGMRLGALVFLLLTVAKVFLHDLWQLGALYRVGSIVGLAVALLIVSFLVQRFVLQREQS